MPARVKCYFQLAVVAFGFAGVIRRFLGYIKTPAFGPMIVILLVALANESVFLYQLQRLRSKEAHMQKSMLLTSVNNRAST